MKGIRPLVVLGFIVLLLVALATGSVLLHKEYKRNKAIQEAHKEAIAKANQAITLARIAFVSVYDKPTEQNQNALLQKRKEAQTLVSTANRTGINTPELLALNKRWQDNLKKIDAFDLSKRKADLEKQLALWKQQEKRRAEERRRAAELAKLRRAEERRRAAELAKLRRVEAMRPKRVNPGEYTVGVNSGIPSPGRYRVTASGDSGNFAIWRKNGRLKVNQIIGGRYGVSSYVFNLENGDRVKVGSTMTFTPTN